MVTPRESTAQPPTFILPGLIGITLAALLTFSLAIGPMEVSVRIRNEAGVNPRTLSRAETIVARIFGASGIRIRWIGEGQACASAIPVLILNRKPPNLHEDATGFAVLIPKDTSGQSYAGVSQPAISEVAQREDMALSTVLGASMAHEIGHVLLGSSHSTSGIMSPRLARSQLKLAESGALLFTATESLKLIQSIPKEISCPIRQRSSRQRALSPSIRVPSIL